MPSEPSWLITELSFPSSASRLRLPSSLSATPNRTRAARPLTRKAYSQAVSLVLYLPLDQRFFQFLSLDPLQLSATPDAEPEISINDKSQGGSNSGFISEEAMTPMQGKLEKLVALDPERWFEVTGGYGEFSPGSGLRRAVELVSLSFVSAKGVIY